MVEDVPPLHVTSGVVKRALAGGQSVDAMLPARVAELIRARGYYR